MFKLLHSKLFRQNLTKWVFMYVAVICLLTSVITYSKYITALGNKGETRSAKFNVSITPLPTDGVECKEITYTEETSNGYTYSECSVKNVIDDESGEETVKPFRPTKPIEFYFKIDVSEMEILSDIFVRASLGIHLKDETSSTRPASVLKIVGMELVDENKENPVPIPARALTSDGQADEANSADIHLESDSTIHIKYNPPVKSTDEDGVAVSTDTVAENTVFYVKITAQYDLSGFDRDEDNPDAIIINNVNERDAIRLDYSATQIVER